MCEYCLMIGGKHDCRCPNAPDIVSDKTCNSCGLEIMPWEEYVENDDGEYIHIECVDGIYDLLDWLRYEAKTDMDK